MPSLYILAGANGSGKTTWYTTAIEENFISSDLTFINVDIIVRKELTGGYSEENYIEAANIARQRIAHCLEKNIDFMIESNLALQADYDWIENMQKKGYQIILYFLGTDDLRINYERVNNRIKEGGHSVPESIITHRYKIGLSYLKSKILLFQHAFLIDNSTAFPRKMAEVKNRELVFKEPDCPLWVKEVLQIVELLQKKKNN
jgi:predicted ABC-type ATPase